MFSCIFYTIYFHIMYVYLRLQINFHINLLTVC